MNVAVWILQFLLAVVFLAAGLAKVTQPHAKLVANPNMAWVGDFPDQMVKTIGTLEILGAIGVTLPALTKIVPGLTPVAACGLGLLMIGAAITHIRRGETKVVPVNVVLLVLAGVVAWARFGPHQITG